MSGPYDYLDPHIVEELNRVWKYFIPNEKIELVIQASGGFIVLTNRRLVLLDSWRGISQSEIKRAFPFDALHSLYEKKQDKWLLEIIKPGKKGNLDGKVKNEGIRYTTGNFDFSPHFQSKKEKTEGLVSQRFTDGMEILRQRIEEKKRIISEPEYVQIHDCSYIAQLTNRNDLFRGLLDLSPNDQAPIVISVIGGCMGIDNERTTYRHEYKGRKALTIFAGRIPHTLLRCLEFDWDRETNPGFRLYWLKYNTKNQKVETNYDGSPIFNFFSFSTENNYSTKGVLPWLRPMMNRPWIIADAYFYKMEKLIPANIPETDTEKPRLWY